MSVNYPINIRQDKMTKKNEKKLVPVDSIEAYLMNSLSRTESPLSCQYDDISVKDKQDADQPESYSKKKPRRRDEAGIILPSLSQSPKVVIQSPHKI